MSRKKVAVVCREGMIRRGAQCRSIARTGPIELLVGGRLADRIRALAVASGATSVESWCEMALEAFVVASRSGNVRLDPGRYDDRVDGEVW